MLEEFVAAHPQDAFGRYGLAMECAQSGDPQAAAAHFHQLLQENPAYVAAYFQYGQLLAKLTRIGEAKQILSAGILAAQKAGDIHAADEMAAALHNLG